METSDDGLDSEERQVKDAAELCHGHVGLRKVLGTPVEKHDELPLKCNWNGSMHTN